MSSMSRTRPWDVRRLPRADGSTFLITGGNAGIGYFVAEQLAGTGATVVLGSRDPARPSRHGSIRSRVRGARLRRLRSDLADLASLRTSVDLLETVPRRGGLQRRSGAGRAAATVNRDGNELMLPNQTTSGTSR